MRLFSILICLLASPLCVALAEDFEIAELEKDFAAAEFHIVNRAIDISLDIRDKLFSIGGRGIADFGERWNPTDVMHPDVPTAQHLFTGESDVVAAVAFRTGGYAGVSLNLLVARRQSDWFCLYHVPLKEQIVDSMDFLQQLFPPQDGSKLKCRRVQVPNG